MHDIFLSYAKEDKQHAQILATVLEKEGFDVWWDVEIPTGQTWDRVIEKAITDAKCVVVLWTKNSIKSEWVNTEAAEGKSRNILIPIRIEDVEIPLAFKRRQTADLINWNGEKTNASFQRILEDIRLIILEKKPDSRHSNGLLKNKKAQKNKKKEYGEIPSPLDIKKKGYIKYALIGVIIIIFASGTWWKIQSDQKAKTENMIQTIKQDSISKAKNKLAEKVKLDSIERRKKIGLGKKFEGGIIFYIDDTGEHGLIMAQGDQTSGDIKWLPGLIEHAGAYDKGIYSGKRNTEKIAIKFGPGEYPARICYDLIWENFDDWYLPSQEELDLLYNFENHESFKHSYYWSSTEISTADVYYKSFFNGKSYDKIENNVGKVRAIRRF